MRRSLRITRRGETGPRDQQKHTKSNRGVMMKSVAKAIEPADRQARFDHIQPHYLEALTLIERLHRRLLDVISTSFFKLYDTFEPR